MSSEIREKISKLADVHLPKNLITAPTNLPIVELFQFSKDIGRVSGFYKPGIAIIGSGEKIVHFNTKTYRYNANHILMTVAPIPVECEAITSQNNPTKGIYINLTPKLIYSLAEILDLNSYKHGVADPFAISSIALTEQIKSVLLRLLDCLASKKDSLILGESIIRELLYRILADEAARPLIEFMLRDKGRTSIMKVLNYINTNYHLSFQNKDLASQACMSSSVFYKCFKEVTLMSPSKYIRNLRLNKARMLLLNTATPIGLVANQVGYTSISHFNNDYKNLFGHSPGVSRQYFSDSEIIEN